MSMPSIPIVVIHQTDSYYLLYSLAQAAISNSNSEVYLIGDYSNNHYKFVRHHNICDYFSEADKFSKLYKHLSTNSFQFELFCFQRWFILKEFMLKNSFSRCFHMDSDVMLYVDIMNEFNKFKDYDFTLSSSQMSDSLSPHCSFINRIEILEDFCEFLTQLYTDSSLSYLMEMQFEKRHQQGLLGGACDMTAFREYSKQGRSILGYTSSIIDGSTYDHRIRSSDGFEMANEIKNIYFQNHQPFCKHLEFNQEIKLNAIHFQGGTKKMMKNYLDAKGFKPIYSSLKRDYNLVKGSIISFLKKAENKFIAVLTRIFTIN